MNRETLNYRLTDQEREAFDRDGYFIVPDVLSADQLSRLNAAVDRIDAEERAANGRSPYETQNILDFIGRDEAFLELLDYTPVFPKVWGILGWNIQLYHSHTIITPPRAPGEEMPKKRLNWHQDSGRLNFELETNPQPRISLKVAYFLTDCSVPGRANLYVIPGSHNTNKPASLDDPAKKSRGGSSSPSQCRFSRLF